MKIEFDKALLWLVPYLYLVSIVYYWSYWGHFGIDAFNYYPLSDLIKGAIEPFYATANGIYSGTIYLIGIAGLIFLIKRIEWLFFTLFLLYIVIALLIPKYYPSFDLFHYEGKESIFVKEDTMNSFLSGIAIFTCSLLSLIICLYINKKFDVTAVKKISDIPVIFFTRFIILAFCLLLPVEAYLVGDKRAVYLEKDIIFDYVITDKLTANQKQLFKLIGKAGEYYFMLTPDNTRYVVVPSGELGPLTVNRFSIEDSLSMERFKTHQQELLTLTEKKIQEQPAMALPPQLK